MAGPLRFLLRPARKCEVKDHSPAERSTHLCQLALARVVQAGSVGNPMQVVQGVHACGEVTIAKRLHGRLLYWSGKVYVFCDAARQR